MTAMTVSRAEVARASHELAKMRRSLKGWLEYRAKNDAVMAGAAPAKRPYALAPSLDRSAEQPLADRLYALLSEVAPSARLPNPDLRANPNAAVELAKIALSGGDAASGPIPQGAFPLSWPVLIVGGLLLAVTTAIHSYADLAKERERYACIQAGACTDYGFWLKAGGAVVIAWFVWEKVGVGERVKRIVRGK